MDNQEKTKTKLSGLRTFSSDQARHEGKIQGKTSKVTPSLQAIVDSHIEKNDSQDLRSELVNLPANYNTASGPKAHGGASWVSLSDTVSEKNHTKNNKVVIDNEGAGSATIITDTKKDRFNVFTATIESIKSWFKEKKAERQAKKAPKYTVPETTRRKGVIQKATSQTGKIISGDHENIQERIRERHSKKQDEHNEHNVPNKTNNTVDDSPETIWTPDTDTMYELLEEKTGEDAVVSAKQEQPKGFVTTQNEIIVNNLDEVKRSEAKQKEAHTKAVSKKDLVEEREVDDGSKAWEAASKSGEVQVRPESQEQGGGKPVTSDKKEETASSSGVSATLADQVLPRSKGQQSNSSAPNREHKGFFLSANTNTVSFVVSAVFIVLVAGGIGGTIWYHNKDKISVVQVEEYPRVIKAAELNLLYQPITNKEDFIQRIITEYEADDYTVTQFAFTTTAEKNNLIKPSALLSFLGIELDSNFKQSINYLYFGGIQFTDPYIALKVADNVAGIGGMLLWEDTMRDDLADVFQLPTDVPVVTDTSTSSEQLLFIEEKDKSQVTYVDATIGGVDVRVLKNSNGEEELIYGFLDSNTIIITRSSTALGKLLTLINN
ncbi:MAG: hypothetical protein H6779_03475 [Candidatus Nomurabacteria bacterium]|nr:hypothetical protein [Candidatus Nomurabacteria bacterium]USN87447.1 MAG: hypothetical protein H6779_03475 [Candidatus Nomurabacteria bacterium]